MLLSRHRPAARATFCEELFVLSLLHHHNGRLRMIKRLTIATAILCTMTLLALNAQAASKEACGGIELTAIGECHFEFSGGCKAKCEPLSFVAACDGKCNAELSASCTGECGASCKGKCEADPGKFDCAASCKSECNASVAAQCEGSSNKDCVAFCEADCASNCDADCDVVAPSATCDAKCEAGCSGKCEVDANFDCSVKCSVDLKGGCEIDCDAPTGGLFCDGQFIAVTDLVECAQYMLENFSISLDISISASAAIEGGCSVGRTPGKGGGAMGGLFALALGLTLMRRRRERLES